LTREEIEVRLKHLMRDFDMRIGSTKAGEISFKLGSFRAFVGQDHHIRHDYLAQMRSRVS
jgi:DNA (cytosine-5)-methyltransferase 1